MAAAAANLVPKQNTSPAVWEHFGFQPNENGEPENLEQAVCKICEAKISVKRGNTSNLRAHLSTHHPAAAARLPKPVSGCRGAASAGTGEELVPFQTVEKLSFTSMLKQFDKQYELPGKTTTDMWSSVGMTPYICLTVHYLTEDWKLKSLCLQTVFMPQNHTAENLAEVLQSAFSEWSLDKNKLTCITTDNGANIVAAVRKMDWPWLNCFGHNLHLAVTNAVSSTKERTARALGVCHTLVSAFSQSWLKRRELMRAQEELQLPQQGLILMPAVRRALDDRKHQHLIPSWQDISVLEPVNAALKPVADFTDLLSGESYVTVSSVRPVLKLLTENVLKPTEEDVALTADIKQKMCSVLLDKYQAASLRMILSKSCLLDPR
ncbi:hypothetical protein WMY93_009930 [Mugilogobius chulae]|uniref:BED-type domain-containing protein n=1 Tax=Mugilogobius chulae TaxID=88201 RepID=A0AAW0PBM8_9GOBI